jgi:hypothetical protein
MKSLLREVAPVAFVVTLLAACTSPASNSPTPYEANLQTTAFSIIDICPSSRFVQLEKLNIPEQFRLIVLPLDLDKYKDYDTGYYLISPTDSKIQYVDVSSPAGTANHNYIVSPDGQWMSFLRESNNDSTNRTLWISSLNGEKQWEVKQLTDLNHSFQWISEDEIVIWGPQNYDSSEAYPPLYYYLPLAVINPFTLEEQPLASIPQEYIDGLQDGILAFRSGTLYYMFILRRFESYFLHSYKDNSTQEVLQWLNGHGKDSFSRWVHREDDFFIITVDQPYGFDLSPKLSISDITQQQDYSKIMRKITLPTEFGQLRVTDMLPQTNLLSLYQNTDIDSSSPIMYFTLDPQNMKLMNYCFEIPRDANVTDSPDGNFITISSISSEDEYPKSEITILNLKTGYVSVLKDYHLVGWGVQK